MARQRVRMPQVRRSKYGAVKTVVDGITFDSKAEARRYGELKLLQKAGEISELEYQPVFPIHSVNGARICDYCADFQYYDRRAGDFGRIVVEDVKGFKTPVYRLKKKFVEAEHGIVIREIH